MGNMGVDRLELVRPVDFLVDEAFARSAGNEAILRNASVRGRLDEAIGDCSVVVGSSARVRTIQWPSLSPQEAMGDAAAAGSRGAEVALVFGSERAGLANRHIDRCTALVRIPVDERSPSINVAQAVMIMLYEYRKASVADAPPRQDDDVKPATSDQMAGYFEHLERIARLTGFIADGPRESLLRKIRRIFVRSGMSEEEVNIMRGIFTAIETQRPAKARRGANDGQDC